MIKAGVGKSSVSNPFQAGVEAVKKALDQVQGEAKIIFVFINSNLDQERVLEGITSLAKEAKVVGVSSMAEIGEGEVSKGSVVAMAISGDNIDFICQKEKISQEIGGFELGKSVAEKIKKESKGKLQFLLLFASGLAENIEKISQGMKSVLGSSLPIIGALASDDLKFEKIPLFFNREIVEDGILAIGVEGDFSFGFSSRHGWQPIGLPFKITKAEEEKVIEIERKPALSLYEEYLGKERKILLEYPLLQVTSIYPLALVQEDLKEPLLRIPIKGNKEGEIVCLGKIPEDAKVKLALGDQEKMMEAGEKSAREALESLKKARPKFALIFASFARFRLFGREVSKEIKKISEIFGKEVAVCGFYDYGEITNSTLLNGTLTILVIGE